MFTVHHEPFCTMFICFNPILTTISIRYHRVLPICKYRHKELNKSTTTKYNESWEIRSWPSVSVRVYI